MAARSLCARTAALLLVAAACVSALDIFVAPNGDDNSGTGSIDKPFATLARAQVAVRSATQKMTEDVFVLLREGDYFVNTTLKFAEEDGGVQGHVVHYAGYQGEHATVHGGVRITGWSKMPDASGIWMASLPPGIDDSRQVYVNGARIFPVSASANILGKLILTKSGYTSKSKSSILGNANQEPSDIEFIYTGVGSSWTECRLRVASVSFGQDLTNITMQQPGFTLGVNKFYGQGVTTPVTVTNLFGLLGPTTPGQYYLNSRQRTVYYVPRPQEDMATADVVVPHIDVLLQVQGVTSPTLTKPVRFLSFERLTFSYAGWLEPNTGLGYVDMQSGFRVLPSSTDNDDTWVPVPGNLQFHTVENVTIVNCTFTHLGATAVVVDDASQSVLIQNNTFTDISCGGVYIGQVNDANQTDPQRENGYFTITNNYFSGIPVEFHDCAVVLGGFVIDTHITHNSIHDCANTGISLGWGWSRDESTNSGWNTIAYNYVNGSNWLLEDGGSIYVLGPQPQSIMNDNYVSHQQKLFGALYTDEGSAYWHITRNVVNDCPEWLHIWTTSIHDEVVDFCWTNQKYQVVNGVRITVSNITYVDPGKPFPPDAQAVMSAAGVDWEQGPKL